MKTRPRLVIDTNALISRLLIPESVPAKAVQKAINFGQLLVSQATMWELADVLSRTKFDAYISVAQRQDFFHLLARIVEWVPISCSITICRDPKDDRILELALSGAADAIVTGDRDLLSLNPFRNIPIISPSEYLRTTISSPLDEI
jgi:putative PIN family toxin of toxin-antitoxin system